LDGQRRVARRAASSEAIPDKLAAAIAMRDDPDMTMDRIATGTRPLAG
jgi:hypothetical protein